MEISKQNQALKQLGGFNSELQLLHCETGEPFKFVDQNHYEQVADAVADFIQEEMVKNYGMNRVNLPTSKDLTAWKNENEQEIEDIEEIEHQLQCPIFVSSTAKTSKTVLILLCGTGRVAAGQWARKLCINDSLYSGSVLPFLTWASQNEIGVVVLNPNLNSVETTKGTFDIPFNSSSDMHVIYAWDTIIKVLPAQRFLLVAHSYGGINACTLLQEREDEVLERLSCIAFTDTVRYFELDGLSITARNFLLQDCTNWVSSPKPLDTVLSSPIVENNDFNVADTEMLISAEWCKCKMMSAGTTVHEETTMSAFTSICNYLTSKYSNEREVKDADV